MGRRRHTFVVLLLLLLLLLLLDLFSATSLAPPSPNNARQNRPDLLPPDVTVSATRNWSTANTAAMITSITAGWSLQPLLIQSNSGPTFACGLLCLRHNDAFNPTNPCNGSRIVFGVFLVVGTGNNSIATNSSPPVAIWLAFRNYPITHPATLRFTETGLLQLDSNGSSVWWKHNVSSINLTYRGNLRLYSSRNGGQVQWQSFDNPTDTALAGQSLSGKQLVANTSAESASEGFYLLKVNDTKFTALVQLPGQPPPQVYYSSNANSISSGILLPEPRDKKMTDYAKTFVRLDVDGTSFDRGGLQRFLHVPHEVPRVRVLHQWRLQQLPEITRDKRQLLQEQRFRHDRNGLPGEDTTTILPT